MVGFAAFADGGVFHFHKIADMHFIGQFGIRAQAGIGADMGACADFAIFQMRKRFDFAAFADFGVVDDAVGADFHIIAQHHIAFKHTVHINHHILAVFQTASQIEAGRIAQGNAGFEQFIGLIALENAFQFSQLHFIVYAGGQMAGAHLHRMHFDAVCIGQCNQVGKVIFALRIVALQGIQPAFQLGIGQHQNAGVDFLHRFLGGIGVFFFHNRHHIATLADDAAVAGGVFQHIGEQAHFFAGGVEQGLQGGRVNQRHIAVEHERAAFCGQVRQRHFHGMPGAQLLGLLHPGHLARHALAHFFFTVADHHNGALGL